MANQNITTTTPFKILGLFIAFIAFFLLLALLSYSSGDPSISHSVQVENIHNLMGKLGSYTASGLLIIFGISAFIIPVFLFEYAYRCFVKKKPVKWLNILSSFIIFLVVLGIVGVFFGEATIIGKTNASGITGTIIGNALEAYLNRWGSLILLLTLLCAGVMLGYDVAALAGFIQETNAKLKNKIQSRRDKKSYAEKKRPPKTITSKNSDIPQGNTNPQITIVETQSRQIKEVPKQSQLNFVESYQFPSLSLLNDTESRRQPITPKELKANAALITTKLKDFGVHGEIHEIKPGPVITMYEYTPAPGIKINKIVALADDLAMALKATPVRVVAPIPGKNAVGIEIPNRTREIVYLRKILASEEFITSTAPLTLALGTNIEGTPVVTDLAKMPHLLIAGATGTGKSVGLNTMILSLIYRCDPNELKFIMIDPKRIELSHYEGIPHLMHPVVSDTNDSLPVLKWVVLEMEQRYRLFKDSGVKNIDTFNRKSKKINKDAPPSLALLREEDKEYGFLPKLVIVIDEMADLIMANREIEMYIARLAQMARAAGIYMIVATQRPSVDVITGLIKANFPARISFRVSSKIDSKTIIDGSGAEQLLGLGDMLLLSPGGSFLRRVHGAYVSEEEIDSVVNFIKEQKEPEYIEDIEKHISELSHEEINNHTGENGFDPMYDEALEFVTKRGSASISLVQRRFRIGYNRAARIIEQMEHDGIIGPADTAGKPRKVLVKAYDDEMET
ncbi:MAG: DNA translocase FtsK 4TM domain-containing protein [Deltaproteobacteria bacterium]|nr:DNA translocase FtsK 4TM domain-containing protein [Deltaproteobacteria bacterium]